MLEFLLNIVSREVLKMPSTRCLLFNFFAERKRIFPFLAELGFSFSIICVDQFSHPHLDDDRKYYNPLLLSSQKNISVTIDSVFRLDGTVRVGTSH